ncbi:MAG: hypothetical protein FWF73_07615 [Spirochaetes bacterium]|nr:hypothetical protein [Spirochaetota bacterium]
MKQTNSYKQKIFFYLSAVIFLSLIISCGGFSKLSNSNIPVDIYVGGNSGGKYSDDRVAVYWKNGEMIPLETKRSNVLSIAVAGNDVYMGGYYIDGYTIQADGYNGIPRACYWKNGKRVSLSNAKYGSSVYDIFVSGNDVYVCGWISNREDEISSGYWKNGKWVGLVKAKDGSWLVSIFVSGDNVYACGRSKNSDVKWRPAYWKNGEWIELPSLNEKKDAFANSIFIAGNDVYLGGHSYNNSGINIACYWKNGKLIALPSLSENKDASVCSIFMLGNDVYFGGYSYDNSGISIACYWKNDKIIPLLLSESKWSSVNSIFVFGRDIYAVGLIQGSDGFDIPGYWKNGDWVKLDAKGYYPSASSIVVVPRPTVQ